MAAEAASADDENIRRFADLPDKLPDTLWGLGELALADLELVEKSPGYTINMDMWQALDLNDDVCHVCMAGAVLAREYGVPRDCAVGSGFVHDSRDAVHLPGRIWQKMLAVNNLRLGHLAIAYGVLYRLSAPEELTDMEMIEYAVNPAQFKESFRKVIDRCKELGI